MRHYPSPEEMTARRAKIDKFRNENPGATQTDIAKAVGLPIHAVQRLLKKHKRVAVVKRHKPKPAAPRVTAERHPVPPRPAANNTVTFVINGLAVSITVRPAQ